MLWLRTRKTLHPMNAEGGFVYPPLSGKIFSTRPVGKPATCAKRQIGNLRRLLGTSCCKALKSRSEMSRYELFCLRLGSLVWPLFSGFSRRAKLDSRNGR